MHLRRRHLSSILPPVPTSINPLYDKPTITDNDAPRHLQILHDFYSTPDLSLDLIGHLVPMREILCAKSTQPTAATFDFAKLTSETPANFSSFDRHFFCPIDHQTVSPLSPTVP